MEKIDNLDRKILNMVMRNARMPSKDIAAVCTYIGISLEKGSMYREALRKLEDLPEVVECHFTTGPYSMLVKVYVQDTSHLMELLNDRIQHIPGVTATETLISLEQSLNRELQLPLVAGSKHYE